MSKLTDILIFIGLLLASFVAAIGLIGIAFGGWGYDKIDLERTEVKVIIKQLDHDTMQSTAWAYGYRRDQQWLGFAVPMGDTCIIHVPPATTDEMIHQTWGHELLHCLGGAWHD